MFLRIGPGFPITMEELLKFALREVERDLRVVGDFPQVALQPFGLDADGGLDVGHLGLGEVVGRHGCRGRELSIPVGCFKEQYLLANSLPEDLS